MSHESNFLISDKKSDRQKITGSIKVTQLKRGLASPLRMVRASGGWPHLKGMVLCRPLPL